MPFKSKKQMKYCFFLNSTDWDCKKWLKETEDVKSLPTYKRRKSNKRRSSKRKSPRRKSNKRKSPRRK